MIATQFLALMRKDIRLFLTDRRAVVMSVVAPIAIASFFGYIFGGGAGNADASRIPVLIADLDRSPVSQSIASNLQSQKELDVKPSPPDVARLQVQKGKVSAALVIPANFGADMARAFLQSAPKPKISILYDPSRSIEMRMLQGMLAGAVMESIGSRASAVLGPNAPRGGLSLPFDSRPEQVLASRDGKYNGYAHSFGGMGIQFLLMVGVEVGVNLLLRRQQGVWKRMRAAPLSRAVMLGSRVASSAVTSMGTLIILFGFARLVFGVRIQGSLLGFVCICAAFSLMTAAFGLLVAALGKTAEGTRPIAILVTLFMVMLGGAWVPSFVFPRWLQSLTIVIPTRWSMDALDAVTWRGLDFSAVALPIGLTFACALFFGAIAVARFRWESD